MKRDKIYFASSGARIKIGVSRNIERRLKEIETHLPEGLALLGTIDGTFDAERRVHKQLDRFRISGEWFRNCEESRSLIAEILAAPVRDWIFVNNGRFDQALSAAERAANRFKNIADPHVRQLMKKARERWPKKTIVHLADCTGMSERAAKYWLSGRNSPSAKAIRLIELELRKAS